MSGTTNWLRAMPFGDKLLIDFAERLLVEEGLGADEVPDLLLLSISATDRVRPHLGDRSAMRPWTTTAGLTDTSAGCSSGSTRRLAAIAMQLF